MNYWLLGGTAAVLVTLAVVIHLVHERQKVLQAAMLRERADEAEQEGKKREAVQLLRQYVATKPDDFSARSHAAILADETAVTPQEKLNSLTALEALLRESPDQNALRKRLVLGWMTFRRERDARTHLALLKPEDFDAGEYEFIQGQCAEIAGEDAAARKWYADSIEKSPDRIDAYARLASLHRSENDSTQRQEVLQRLLTGNPQSVKARLTAATFAFDEGDRVQTATLISEALKIEPGNADALVMAAGLAAQPSVSTEPASGPVPDLLSILDTQQIAANLEQALAESPEDLRLYRALSQLASVAGDTALALKWLQTGADNNRNAHEIGADLVRALVQAERLDAARSQLKAMTAAGAPFELTSTLATYVAAVDRFNKKQWQEALSELQNAKRRLPDDDELEWFVDLRLAECLRQLNDPKNELAVLESTLRGRPHDASNESARLRLAFLKWSAGQFDEALALFSTTSNSVAEAAARAESLLMRAGQLPDNQRDWAGIEGSTTNQVRGVSSEGDKGLQSVARML